MKNNGTKIFALLLTAFFVFGCGYIGDLQKSVQDTTSNTNAGANAVRENLGLKKSGIAECDELIELISTKGKQSSNSEDSWFNKAAEELIKQKVYDQLSQDNANRTPQDKADLAKNCKLALDYMREPQSDANKK